MIQSNLPSLTWDLSWDIFKSPEKVEIPKIEKVIFQKTHTIVLWKDKSEPTIVNCYKEDFDKEKGLAMAIVKKYMKRNEFKKLIDNANYQDR